MVHHSCACACMCVFVCVVSVGDDEEDEQQGMTGVTRKAKMDKQVKHFVTLSTATWRQTLIDVKKLKSCCVLCLHFIQIGCEDCLRNDQYCVGTWLKLYLLISG